MVTVWVKFILRCLLDISVGTAGNVEPNRNRLCYKRRRQSVPPGFGRAGCWKLHLSSGLRREGDEELATGSVDHSQVFLRQSCESQP